MSLMLCYQTEDSKPKLHTQMRGELLFMPPDVLSTIIPIIQANATTHSYKESPLARLVKPESD